MFCKKCGSKLRDGARFCASCGNAVAPPDNEPTVSEQQLVGQTYGQPLPDQQLPSVQAYGQQFQQPQPPQPPQPQGFGEPAPQGLDTQPTQALDSLQPQGFGTPPPQDFGAPSYQDFGGFTQPTPAEQAFDQLVQQQEAQGYNQQQGDQAWGQQPQPSAPYGHARQDLPPTPAPQQYQQHQQGAAYQQPYQQPLQQAMPQPAQPGGFPTPAPAATSAQMAGYAPGAPAKKKSSKLLPVLIGAGGLVVIAIVAIVILAVLGIGPFAGGGQPIVNGGSNSPGISVSKDTITFMVRVSDDTAVAEQQKAYWQKVVDGFQAKNPQITVEIVAVPTSRYETEFVSKTSSGQAPTVFGTGGLSSEQINDAAYPLDQLLSFINRNDYLFLNDYEALFPDKKQLPPSFDVTIVYANTTAAANMGITVPDKISSLDQLLENDTPIVVEKTALPDLLALYNPDIATSSGIALSEDNENQIVRTLAADKQSANDSAVGMFTSGAAVYYVGNKSSWWALGGSVPEGITAIPLENNGTIGGNFADLFSASATATDNQKNAAVLFLAHLLSEEAQNELYVTNDRHIPLNRAVFDSYISTNTRFAFLADREADIKFYRNSCAELVSFSDKLYNEAILPKLNEESIRGLLNSYRK